MNHRDNWQAFGDRERARATFGAVSVATNAKVLVVAGNDAEVRDLVDTCERHGCACKPTKSPREAERLVTATHFALAVVDPHLSSPGGLVTAQRIHLASPNTRIALIGYYCPSERLLSELRCGPIEWVKRPISPTAFGQLLETLG